MNMNKFKVGDRVEIIVVGIYLNALGTIEKICDDGGYDLHLDLGRTVHVFKESIRPIKPITPEHKESMYKTAESYLGADCMQKENKRSERVRDEELINNSLPKWKGELFNYYTCLDVVYYYDYYDMGWKYNAVSGYIDCTIPPQYMHYICTTHHLCNKIHAILAVHGNGSVIMKKLNIDENAVRKIIGSISDKIYIRNMQESGNDEYADKNYKFNKMELSLLSLIDKLDNPVDSAGDYFPIEMTYLEIMKAVREAYGTARKISERKLQRVRDKRILYPMHNEDIAEPAEGRILYEGESKHGLTIRFWYNFDLNLIEDAYPVRKGTGLKIIQ